MQEDFPKGGQLYWQGDKRRLTTLFLISEFSDDINVFRQNNVPNIVVIKTNHVRES